MPEYLIGHYQYNDMKRPRVTCVRITTTQAEAVDSLPPTMFEIHLIEAANKRDAIRVFWGQHP